MQTSLIPGKTAQTPLQDHHTSLKHTVTTDQILPHILSNIALDAQNHQRLVLFPSSLALQWLMLDLTIDL
jgi:hypothetical protein